MGRNPRHYGECVQVRFYLRASSFCTAAGMSTQNGRLGVDFLHFTWFRFHTYVISRSARYTTVMVNNTGYQMLRSQFRNLCDLPGVKLTISASAPVVLLLENRGRFRNFAVMWKICSGFCNSVSREVDLGLRRPTITNLTTSWWFSPTESTPFLGITTN